MDKTANDILKKQKKKKIDYLRVIFNIPVGYEDAESPMNFFKERFKDMKNIKLKFCNGYVENEKELRHVEFSELSEESKILLDKNIPKEDKINYFLKVRKNIDMSTDRIAELLHIKKGETENA